MTSIMALMIPILALCIPFLAIWAKHQQKIERMRLEHEARYGRPESAELTRLEERIRVLERIAVENRGADALSREIEDLRDKEEA